MTTKIDQIGKEIIQKTGINFEKYRKPELIGTIVDVSTFIINPLASVPIFLKSFVFTLFTIVFVLFVITKTGDINMTAVILMFFIGLVGFPFIGSSIAVRRVGNKIIEDIKNALNIAMDLSIEIIKDLKQMNLKRIPPVTDIIRGVVYVILIPSLETVIAEKITFLGKHVAWLMKKILFTFTKTFVGAVDKIIPDKKAAQELDQALKQDIQKLQNMNPSEESRMLNTIEKARDMIASLLLETVMPKILLPFTIVFYGSSGVTCAAIFLVYLMLA